MQEIRVTVRSHPARMANKIDWLNVPEDELDRVHFRERRQAIRDSIKYYDTFLSNI
jgi:hypothetical protein